MIVRLLHEVVIERRLHAQRRDEHLTQETHAARVVLACEELIIALFDLVGHAVIPGHVRLLKFLDNSRHELLEALLAGLLEVPILRIETTGVKNRRQLLENREYDVRTELLLDQERPVERTHALVVTAIRVIHDGLHILTRRASINPYERHVDHHNFRQEIGTRYSARISP